MDVMMPCKDGVDACREIMELLPEIRVLMLTASTEEDAVIEAIAAGATGYLEKYSPTGGTGGGRTGCGCGEVANTGKGGEGGLRDGPRRT